MMNLDDLDQELEAISQEQPLKNVSKFQIPNDEEDFDSISKQGLKSMSEDKSLIEGAIKIQEKLEKNESNSCQ